MRVRHHPTVDSSMARYWRGTDVFELTDDFSHVILTLSGDEVIRIIQTHYAHVATIQDSLRALVGDTRIIYRARTLKGQHKVLKTLPSSPHDARPAP